MNSLNKKQLIEQLKEIKEKKSIAMQQNQYEFAASLRDKEKEVADENK